MNDWTIRRCCQCGALESDVEAEFIVEQRSDRPDRIWHVVANGLRRCGLLVAVDDEVES
jgi:hypothetical protein